MKGLRCEGKHITIVSENIQGVVYCSDIVSKEYWLFFKDIGANSYQLISKNRKRLRKQLKSESIIIDEKFEYKLYKR